MPAPGHMLPAIALGKSLARHGVKVTFLSSGTASETLCREVEEDEEELDMSIGSVVEDPIPEPAGPWELVPWLCKLTPVEMASRTAEMMQQLSPPPCLLIVDAFLAWSALVEVKLSIPRHFLVTMSAAMLAFMFSVLPRVRLDPVSLPNHSEINYFWFPDCHSQVYSTSTGTFCGMDRM